MTVVEKQDRVEEQSRQGPERSPPAHVPPDILGCDTSIDQFTGVRSSQVGILDLELAPVAGKTRIVRQFQTGPLYILRPIYTDTQRPDQAFIYTIQLGDGMVQGDRYRLDLKCAPGSAAHFTTQSATKIYRMEENFACQLVNLSVGAGAFVEYLPDPVIPFRDSRCYQHVRLDIDATASLILGEILLPGRVAHGESHVYTFYHSDTEASRPDGTLLFADRIRLDPTQVSPHSPGRLGPYDVLASLYIITSQTHPRDLVDRLHRCLTRQAAVLAGVSELPNGSGVSVRMLGRTALAVKNAFQRVWNEARLALIGVPAPDLRKG